MVKNDNTVVLNHSTILLREDGIVEVKFINNSIIDVKACEELLAVYDQILENKKYPILHLTGEFVTFTKKARSFSASDRGLQYSKVEAYVFTSLAYKIVANFYIKFNKPRVSTRFFKSKEEALTWLKNYQ